MPDSSPDAGQRRRQLRGLLLLAAAAFAFLLYRALSHHVLGPHWWRP